MYSRSHSIALPRFILFAGILLAVTLLALAVYGYGKTFAQAGGAIPFPENGTGPVATYSATDPDGSAVVSWTLSGDDAGDFKIEDGVLRFSFKNGPDFEDPKGGGQDPTDVENTYSVTVQATDATRRIGTKDVTVEVTNVDEAGSVRLSAVQPQAGTSFYVIDEDGDTAAVTDIKDQDGISSSIEWQWSKSKSKTSGFADIDKATNSSYTPKDTDNGYYLRVTASYTDREGPGKSAHATSSYPVQRAPSQNAAPKFADDQDPDTVGDQANAPRSIAENTPKGVDIGSPIEAEDLNPGKLTYTLEGTNADDFSIDRETGQLKTKSALGAEATATYEVTVRATDPSGDPQAGSADEANSDTVIVDITIEDLAEAPQISDKSIEDFAENGDITAALAAFTAVVESPATLSRWSLAGPDAGDFEFADPATGALTFKKQPDYEKPADADEDNVYEITVRATDSDSRTGTRDVTVKVTNFDEDGSVTLSPTQHRVGVEITATLKDNDGGVYGEVWQWSIGAGAATTDEGDISGATSRTYTPKAGDVGGTLTATVTYRDAAGGDTDDTALLEATAAVLRDTRNKAPVFEDSKGNTITMAERSVAENVTAASPSDDAADATDNAADNIGAVIVAKDPNIASGAEGDSLAFSLSGPDGSKFRLRAPPTDETGATRSVQIEVKSGTKFDFETKRTYMVTLTARDDYGETADLALTINITDVNDAPVIVVGPATGLNITGPASRNYQENGSAEVGTYRALGPNAASAGWSLSGVDAADFRLSATSGASVNLMFVSTPDYERPADADGNNVYMVTLTARAGSDLDAHNVVVTVTDVDETGTGTGTLLQRYDADGNNDISDSELQTAILDWSGGTLTDNEMLSLILLWS